MQSIDKSDIINETEPADTVQMADGMPLNIQFQTAF